MHNPEPNLEGKIKAEAFRLGFNLCGITSAESPSGYFRYENWLSNRQHAGMAYLETNRHRSMRQDPELLVPEVKSIISLAWPYRLTLANPESPSNEVLVAGYTSGKDYHLLLPAKLEQLAFFIQFELGESITAQAFTDSAPILEREIACRAGLGWIGKNSCLISPKTGSAFLLAELFVDAPLKSDPPFIEDHCGSCHRCIDACPTSCIQSDRTIDSKRCISYLTIENKGGIPEEFRSSMGNWIFGCDICQTVCPWNRHHLQIESLIGDHWTSEQVVSFLKLSPQDFSILFRETAFFRAKLNGLQRNALVWLGNNAGIDSIREITDYKDQITDPYLISCADWALRSVSQSDRKG